MKLVGGLGLVAFGALVPLVSLGPVLAAQSEDVSMTLFTCAIGAKSVSVTAGGGRLIYRYGTIDKNEMSIVGNPAAGNIFQMTQRYAGMEYQLRFKTGEFNYIVYSAEGNERVGASATSGLVVMRGTKRISDKSCSRFAPLAMPEAALKGVPDDTDAYSAM